MWRDHSRVVLINVVPDSAPRVRIQKPGRDLAFTTPNQTVEVTIEADDAEGLRNLELRFTRMSGSGESFEFAEGQVPVRIHRASATRWTATANWSLDGIGLEDGDSLVYRAMVRDNNPSADWVPSESFTIDVGKRLEFAGAGFAVPDEDRRYAVSQQMVIMKTERLQAERGKHAADDWAEQTRFLAIEQRMVRSEVVFLSGGEVEDEVEEAAQSDELQEGRLENAGRAEMLRAINEMSRAEARLNAGDTVEALVFERAALKALQRAFDRRRYFLRTMPERARIDASRRLSGDRKDAQSFTRPSAPDTPDAVAAERALMADLVLLAGNGQTAPPVVAGPAGAVRQRRPRVAGDDCDTGERESRRNDRRAAAAAAMNASCGQRAHQAGAVHGTGARPIQRVAGMVGGRSPGQETAVRLAGLLRLTAIAIALMCWLDPPVVIAPLPPIGRRCRAGPFRPRRHAVGQWLAGHDGAARDRDGLDDRSTARRRWRRPRPRDEAIRCACPAMPCGHASSSAGRSPRYARRPIAAGPPR